MAVLDWDDFHENNHRLDLLHQLKELNPALKATLYAVPGLGTPNFWASVPEWLELVPHGWMHPDPHECQDWSYSEMVAYMNAIEEDYPWFERGFKAPGWQISDGIYDALLHRGWWVADQHLEDGRRPKKLPVYFYEDGPDRWHGHIQDVCGNGLVERWDEVVALVKGATEFWFCSERLSQRHHPVVTRTVAVS